jgi:arylsulfatase A-like enzyme
MRVPLLVRPPKSATGASVKGIVELLDLFPTFCEIAGLAVPGTLDGRSFLRLLKDPEARGKEGAFCQSASGRTVRTLQWRFIERNDGSHELYDHRTDPDDYHNVAGNPDHLSVVHQLQAMLEAELGPRPAPHNRSAFPEFHKNAQKRASP